MIERLKKFIKKSTPEIVFSALSILVGLVSALLTKGNMQIYEQINSPPLAPPAWLFPIAWSILYILMGIGAGMVFQRRDTSSEYANDALKLFFVQLAVNFIWTIVFFNLRSFWLSLVLLIALLILVVLMTLRFDKVNRTSARLQIPYILWLLFAAYLNLAIAILN